MLTSPSGKTYIGQTIRSIYKRLQEHETGQSNGCRAIYNAIQFYGWENIEKDWYYCPDEDLNKHEELMVEVLGTLAPNGYNLRKGGENCGKMSDETRGKMSEAKLGTTLSDGTRQKMSKTRLGKSKSDETRQKMRDSLMSETNPRCKRVYQYALDGTFIDSFRSYVEAGIHLKKCEKIIGKCARGVRGYKTAYTFKWSHNLEIFI